MKTVATALQSLMESELMTLAVCWKLSLVNGADYFFTDHDTDLIIDGDTYEAASGVLPLAMNQTSKLSLDNMDVITFLESSKISEDDILAGDLDYATVDIFIVDYTNLVATLGSVIQGDRLGYDGTGDNSGGFGADTARVLYLNTQTVTVEGSLGDGYMYCASVDAFGNDSSDIRMLVYEIGVDDAPGLAPRL